MNIEISEFLVNGSIFNENGEKYWLRILETEPTSEEISYSCYQNTEN